MLMGRDGEGALPRGYQVAVTGSGLFRQGSAHRACAAQASTPGGVEACTSEEMTNTAAAVPVPPTGPSAEG